MRRYSLSLAIALLGFAAMHPAEAGLRPADPPRPGLVEKVLLLCPLGYRFDPTFRRCVRRRASSVRPALPAPFLTSAVRRMRSPSGERTTLLDMKIEADISRRNL